MVGAGERVRPRPLQRVQLGSPSGTQEQLRMWNWNKTKPPQTPGIGTAANCSEMWVEKGREIRNPAQPYEWIWAKSQLPEIVLNSSKSEWEWGPQEHLHHPRQEDKPDWGTIEVIYCHFIWLCLKKISQLSIKCSVISLASFRNRRQEDI